MKLKELEKRLKAEPTNLGLRVQVAGLLREAGRSIEAVELYRSVALAYRDQGRAQQAIAVCRSILDIAPEDAACHGLLAMLQGRGTQPRPLVVEPLPTPAAPVRAATGGPMSEPRGSTNTTPVKITEPVKVPSVPNLRPITKDMLPVQLEPEAKPEPRRSSIDETPLPRPVPYHEYDRTSQPSKISARDLDEKSTPNITSRTGGLAEAARRISGLISNDGRDSSRPGIPKQPMDISAELDTRQRPKIKSEELRKITELPDPEETHPRAEAMPFHAPTRDPMLEDIATEPIEPLTPPPRGSDDMFTPAPRGSSHRDYTPRPGDDLYTPPPRSSDDAITPPPLAGYVPPEVAEPPKSTAKPSRPPNKISIPPPNPDGKTKSVPPLGMEPVRPTVPNLRPTPSLPPMQTGTPPPPRTGPPAARPVVPLRPYTAPTRPVNAPERDSMAPTNPKIVAPPATSTTVPPVGRSPLKSPTVPPPARSPIKSPTVPPPAKPHTVARATASIPPRGGPPPRPAVKIPQSRDSEDELTVPRDKTDPDDE